MTLPLPALKSVLEEYLLAITQGTERLTRHQEHIAAQVPQWAMYPAVQALMCFRGFDLVAASMLVAAWLWLRGGLRWPAAGSGQRGEQVADGLAAAGVEGDLHPGVPAGLRRA